MSLNIATISSIKLFKGFLYNLFF